MSEKNIRMNLVITSCQLTMKGQLHLRYERAAGTAQCGSHSLSVHTCPARARTVLQSSAQAGQFPFRPYLQLEEGHIERKRNHGFLFALSCDAITFRGSY